MPIGNRGFLYGDGCFETIRLHRGAPFRLEAHLTRLHQSLELLRFESGWSRHDLLQGMRKVVEANHLEDGLVRLTLTAGERPTTRGTATITTRSLPEIPADPALHVSIHAKRLSGPLSQCKSISRVAESVALREANEEGAFDAILLNEKGRVAETTSRNVFLVVDGGLWTPPTYDGALAGVTRAVVIEIARREKIRLKEASVSLQRLRSADEVVITGSGVGVLGIGSIDGHRVEAPGPVTRRLRTAYDSALETESRW
ncbi:MAG TPA: aminotransferase class IV [Thermoplasmata archaeon]|nr:aminotransferase class IV [Thermoplasmata archaeon]